MTGTVKFFNGRKGYGFITGEDEKEYFVHFSGINKDGYKTLKNGATVTFDVEADGDKEKAVNVTEK